MNPSAPETPNANPTDATVPFTLAQALRRAQNTLNAEMPPTSLLADTMAATMAATPAPSTSKPTVRWWRWPWPRPAHQGFSSFATVATLALTGGTVLWLLQPDRLIDRPAVETAAIPLPDGFVAVAPPERWPAGPSSGWLVPAELGRDRLAAMGLPFDPGRAAERLPAELLLAPSGEVLAVRLQSVAMR